MTGIKASILHGLDLIFDEARIDRAVTTEKREEEKKTDWQIERERKRKKGGKDGVKRQNINGQRWQREPPEAVLVSGGAGAAG